MEYRSANGLHDVGVKTLVATHILSSMWAVFVADRVSGHLYYINNG